MANPNRKIQRNDPCPCGSGKKYKHCCLMLANAPDPDSAKHKLYESYALLFGRVSDYLHDDLPPEFAALAWEQFHLGDPPEMDPESSEMIEFFLPWALFYWRPEVPYPDQTFGEEPANDELEEADADLKMMQLSPLAHMFLDAVDGRSDQSGKYRHHKVTPLERSLISQLSQSPYSFFQVKEVVDNKYVTVTDLLVERHETVFMPEFAEELSVGLIIYGQVITVDGITILPSVAPMIFFEDIAPALGRMQQKVTELMPELGDNWRLEMDDEIRGLCYVLAERVGGGEVTEGEVFDAEVLDGQSDAFANSMDSDMDPDLFEDPSKPVLTTLTYELSGELQDHVSALAHLSGNTAEELLCSAEIEMTDDGSEHETLSFEWWDDELPDDEAGAHLGEIMITPHQVRANLIGQGPDERFKQEIEQHFGARAKLIDCKVVTVSDMMGELIKQRVSDRISRRK
jgi:hypothetical protein